jgi:3-hydroxyisobutyrate dehydrogenase-like beta-hydroxyacid dehydrogenase
MATQEMLLKEIEPEPKNEKPAAIWRWVVAAAIALGALIAAGGLNIRARAKETVALGTETARLAIVTVSASRPQPEPGSNDLEVVDIIISFLPDDRAVREVYYGPDGVIANAARGLLILEMSTVLPDTARKLYQAGAARGIRILDAPVSGSTPAAVHGALTVLAGGDPKAFEACVPIFRQIAREWLFLGPSGAGAAMKLVVNALLGAGMQAIAEAVALGETLGLERERLFDVLAEMPVVAPAHRGKLAQASRRDYQPQFPLWLMRKDFGLILDQAAKHGVSMPVAAAAQKEFSAEAAGDGDEDFSVVVRNMERRAKLGEPEFPTAA